MSGPPDGARVVRPREEHDGDDHRYLGAYLTESGDLELEGQDLGRSTWPVSSDSEYEWYTTIPSRSIPDLLTLLDAPRDADVLDVLEQSWAGKRSYELEERISQSRLPFQRHVL